MRQKAAVHIKPNCFLLTHVNSISQSNEHASGYPHPIPNTPKTMLGCVYYTLKNQLWKQHSYSYSLPLPCFSLRWDRERSLLHHLFILQLLWTAGLSSINQGIRFGICTIPVQVMRGLSYRSVRLLRSTPHSLPCDFLSSPLRGTLHLLSGRLWGFVQPPYTTSGL